MGRPRLTPPPATMWLAYCAGCGDPINPGTTKAAALRVSADCRCDPPRPTLRATKYAIAEVRKAVRRRG